MEEGVGEGEDVETVEFAGAVCVDICVNVGEIGLAVGLGGGVEDGGDEVGDVVSVDELVAVHVAARASGAVADQSGTTSSQLIISDTGDHLSDSNVSSVVGEGDS